MGKLDLTPISIEELATVLGSDERARQYATMTRSLMSNIGIDNIDGPIRSKLLRETLETKLAEALFNGFGITSPTPSKPHPLIHKIAQQASAAKTLNVRTAWLHTAFVQARRLYDEAEIARGYVDTSDQLRAEMGL
ncbi:MAG: hypothetical protein WAX89_03380 [Alphaproteobacteria bacterium]